MGSRDTDSSLANAMDFQITSLSETQVIGNAPTSNITTSYPSLFTSRLIALPTELQLLIFTHLDAIDSTCLGLSHPSLYTLHRTFHPKPVPLNQRRIGPNRLESAWEVVGLDAGKGVSGRCCGQCGVYFCLLHRHITSWIPADMEYCSVSGRFGKSGTGTKGCYRDCPPDPRRCGRHPIKGMTGKIVVRKIEELAKPHSGANVFMLTGPGLKM
jgi:hypothetical protein